MECVAPALLPRGGRTAQIYLFVLTLIGGTRKDKIYDADDELDELLGMRLGSFL